MRRLIKELSTRSWRQYIPATIATIVATIFIFLQITASTFLQSSLDISVAKTSSKAEVSVVESEFGRDSSIRKILQLPGVKTAEINTAAVLQASVGSKVISLLGYSQTASNLGAVVISAGNLPADENGILLSQAAAKELKIGVGAQINLIAEQSDGPQISQVSVSGITQRSPFSLEPQRFEIISANLATIAPEAAANQVVGANNMIEVYADGTVKSAELNQQVMNLVQGQVISADHLREFESDNQQAAIDYLQSATRWLFCIPTMFCVFILLSNMRKVLEQNRETGLVIYALGYSYRKLFEIIACELMIFMFFASMLGIALGRAISVLATSYFASRPIGAFIAPLPPTHFTQYLYTILFVLLLALFTLFFTALMMKAVAHKINGNTPAEELFVQQQITAVPVGEESNKAPKQKRDFSRRRKTKSFRELLGVELLLISLVAAVVIYYVVIIPENLLNIAEFSAEMDSLRSVTRIALLLLIGIVLYFGLRKLLHQLIPVILGKFFYRQSGTYHLKFLNTQAIEFSAIFLIGTLAAILALATNSQISDLSYGNAKSRDLAYQVTVERVTQENETGRLVSDQDIVTLLQGKPNVAAVIALHSFDADIYQNQNPFLSDLPIVVADKDFSQFILQNVDREDAQSALPKDGVLILPNEYNWLESEKSAKTEIGVELTKDNTIFSKPFEVVFADIPLPAISVSDANEIKDQIDNNLKITHGDSALAENNAAFEVNRVRAELQQASHFLVSFDEDGKTNLTESYRNLTLGINDLPNLQFSLKSSPTPLFMQNLISTWITIVLLGAVLVFTLLNLATAYFTAIVDSRKHFRLAYTLGISMQQLAKTIMSSALGVTFLSVTIGSCVGIITGVFLAREFIGFIPDQFLQVIPWGLAALILLISMAFVGVVVQIKILTNPQILASNRTKIR